MFQLYPVVVVVVVVAACFGYTSSPNDDIVI